jgi:ubiquinone/menaquinone biosynthesis C-methylase UbiE
MKSANESVSKFYNTIGWKTEQEITEDARKWEDLRKNSTEYVSKCRMRIFNHIPENGENLLDMASGPIQYKEYLEYSKNFNKRYCIDLSLGALESAREKIGDHGVFIQGDFLEIPLEENFFDCSISLHTIYHIDQVKQEDAVRKLLKVTKPGKPVIIVYSNPNAITSSILFSFIPFVIRKVKVFFLKFVKGNEKRENIEPYFYPHPIIWWERFKDVAKISILPWRSLSSNFQKRLIPNNILGKKLLNLLFYLEEKFPKFFVRYFQYPMIILIKKK